MADIVKLTIKDKTCYPLNIPEAVVDPNDNKPLSDTLPFIKDKKHNEKEYSGMGRRYLKKNMIAGVNVLEQSMINSPNTIYIIQYDFNLQGESITIPENCTLDFQGGSFSNGKIVGNDTVINGLKVTNINFKGTFNVDSINASNLNYDNDNRLLDNLLALANGGSYTFINIDKDLNIDVSENSYVDVNGFLQGRDFLVPSNVSINIKNTINVLPNECSLYSVFYCKDVRNITFKGGGKIIGDVEEHSGELGQWGHGIALRGSSNVYIENLHINNFWGDGISVDSSVNSRSSNVRIKDVILQNNRRQGISLEGVINILVDNCLIEGTGSIKYNNPGAAIDVEPWRAGEIAEDVIIRNCIEKNNKRGFICNGRVNNIHFYNCISHSDLTSNWIEREAGKKREVSYHNCIIKSKFTVGGDTINIYNCKVGCIELYDVSYFNLIDSDIDVSYLNSNVYDEIESAIKFDFSYPNLQTFATIKKCSINAKDKKIYSGQCAETKKISTYNSQLFSNTEIELSNSDYFDCSFYGNKFTFANNANRTLKLYNCNFIQNQVNDTCINFNDIQSTYLPEAPSYPLFSVVNANVYIHTIFDNSFYVNWNIWHNYIFDWLSGRFNTSNINDLNNIRLKMNNAGGKHSIVYNKDFILKQTAYNMPTLAAEDEGVIMYHEYEGHKKYKLWNGSEWVNLDGTSL